MYVSHCNTLYFENNIKFKFSDYQCELCGVKSYFIVSLLEFLLLVYDDQKYDLMIDQWIGHLMLTTLMIHNNIWKYFTSKFSLSHLNKSQQAHKPLSSGISV